MSFDRKENIILEGVAAAPGIKMGEAYYFDKKVFRAVKLEIEDTEAALKQFHEALEKSKRELQKILDLAVDKLGKDRVLIFEAQIMILDDPVMIETIERRIEEEKMAPAYIVDDEISKYQDMMNQSDDPYMRERANDVEDIKNRIIRNLRREKWKSKVPENKIIVAESLTPSDTVLFAKRHAQAFVTDFGGLTSHTAILARSLNIPAVVGLHDATIEIVSGDFLIVDGFYGVVYVNPDEKIIEKYRRKIEKLHRVEEELKQITKEKITTTDGISISVLGNLDVEDELEYMITNNAEGIGLVRTEQLFSEHEFLPSEEVQFEYYLNIAEKMYPKDVVIRVFDVGGDKVLPIDVKESNPFLGWRGIRFLLDNKPQFEDQLKAILRASIRGNIKIMLPMVTAMDEVLDTISLLEKCKKDLRNAETPFDENIQLGIMVEVPAAAVLIPKLAKHIKFISLGTNDLIQYLLAVDRTNEIVSELYQEFHPSVVQTIKHIVDNAEKSGLDVTICGELAADTLATPLLVGLGLKALSVSAVSIPYIKRIVKNLSLKEASNLAEKALMADTHNEVAVLLKEFEKEHGLDFESIIFEED